MTKLERPFRRLEIEFHGLIFVRSDVSEKLINFKPDKGKVNIATLDLKNREILREILRLRVCHAVGEEFEFDVVWRQLFVSHINSTADEISDFLLERCFMRPRCLIDLVNNCRSNAVTLQREKITEDDIKEGLAEYSVELANNIGYEIRHIYKEGKDVIYALIGTHKRIPRSQLPSATGTILCRLLTSFSPDPQAARSVP